jgi:N-acyl-D-aspartate/D-glutamate deacylase
MLADSSRQGDDPGERSLRKIGAVVERNVPQMVCDPPSGAGRLTQPASSYLATIVAGGITCRNDAETGARSGRLVRSQRRVEAPLLSRSAIG